MIRVSGGGNPLKDSKHSNLTDSLKSPDSPHLNNRIYSKNTRDSANIQACKGDAIITLFQCQDCGYIFNATFDIEKIKKEYQSSGYFSRKVVSKQMNSAIAIISEKLIPYLNQESVCLEIAPGSGDMVAAIAKYVKLIYTIDPSLVSLEIENVRNLQHIQGFFEYKIVKKHLKSKVDFIIFRHLLEHIPEPMLFLRDVMRLLREGGMIYVEVPNIDEFIEHKRFYEIFNDHCGYYQKSVLKNALSSLNCEFIDEVSLFSNQHMGLLFKKNESAIFKHFGSDLSRGFLENLALLQRTLLPYKRIAIYGSGAHGNTLISFLDNTGQIIKCFDLDSRKCGKFLQNSDILVCAPTRENFLDIDCICIAAPLYENEILKNLREWGYDGDIVATATQIQLHKGARCN